MNKKKYVWFIAGIIFLVFITMLSRSNAKNDTSQQSANAQTTGSANKDESPSFQKITIKDLVALNFKDFTINASPSTVPFVEYQGKVAQEKIIAGVYYFKIEDENGYSAVASIDPKKTPSLNKKLTIGDTVIIRGINSTLGSCKSSDWGSSRSVEQKSLCDSFNITENSLPATLLIAPDPQLGNKQPIEIISSSPALRPSAVSQTPQPIQNTPPVAINYSSYPRMQIDQYAKNPPAYLGTGMELTGGIVSDFLAKGDRGGSTNYIEVENGMDPSLDKLEIQVSSSSDFQSIASKLNKGDFINVFGLGIPSKSFTTAGGQTVLIPSINAQKISKCQPYDCQEVNTTVIFAK